MRVTKWFQKEEMRIKHKSYLKRGIKPMIMSKLSSLYYIAQPMCVLAQLWLNDAESVVIFLLSCLFSYETGLNILVSVLLQTDLLRMLAVIPAAK